MADTVRTHRRITGGVFEDGRAKPGRALKFYLPPSLSALIDRYTQLWVLDRPTIMRQALIRGIAAWKADPSLRERPVHTLFDATERPTSAFIVYVNDALADRLDEVALQVASSPSIFARQLFLLGFQQLLETQPVLEQSIQHKLTHAS